MDKRIQKTRQLIMNTFIQLLSEKKFDKITINDIANRANINRGTVYLHYIDKYDLLDKCIETYTQKLMHFCESETTADPNVNAFISVFEYLRENYDHYKILLTNEGVGYFRNALYSMIESKFMEIVEFTDDNSSFSKEILSSFLTSAAVGVIEWWIVNSMPCSTEEVATQLWEQALCQLNSPLVTVKTPTKPQSSHISYQ